MTSSPSVMYSLSEGATEQAGERLGRLLRRGDVVLLSGDLGAGKTHLTKGVARGLGVAEEVTSPTFNLVLVHEGRETLYHVDLYRLERADELEGIGYFDAIEGDGVAVVEWGDRFAEAEPADFVLVTLHVTGDDTRDIAVEAAGPRGADLAARWIDACRTLHGVNVESDAWESRR